MCQVEMGRVRKHLISSAVQFIHNSHIVNIRALRYIFVPLIATVLGLLVILVCGLVKLHHHIKKGHKSGIEERNRAEDPDSTETMSYRDRIRQQSTIQVHSELN